MAKPWRLIGSVNTDEGLLELRERGEADYLISIDNRVLMSSSANISEIVLAELACAPLTNKKNPRVLVSGLGMGFTLKAAIDNLPAGAEVVVAEINPIVVQWCQGPIAHLTGGALADPRVTVVVGDVAAVIRDAASKTEADRFDAIILDLYEGPYEADYLFGAKALEVSRSALRADGVFAVWSEDPDKAFEKRLQKAKFSVDLQRPGRGGRKHAVYIARKADGGKSGRAGKSRPAARKTHKRA
ncbi:MAG: spermidine synthase [Bradymonadia bacterium]|jgi:spermidine synthase